MKIVIVGGGFGGVRAAIQLAKKDPKAKISLISDEPYFLYHATLYSVATGRGAGQSVISLGRIFRNYPNVTIVKDRIEHIDGHRKIVTGTKDYTYDYLIMAVGVVTTYFGINGMQQHAYGIKTLEEVTRFREHIYNEVIQDKHLDKNYVVVGAGPTGVELAGALNSYLQELKNRAKISRSKVSIKLVEAAPRILPRASEDASKRITARLRKSGIEVLTSHKVEALSEETIVVDGKVVPSHSVVWTSGVTNHPIFEAHPDFFKLQPNKKVIVDSHLSAYPHIFVIGDNASTPYSGLATTALHDGNFIADHIIRLNGKRHLRQYKPFKAADAIPVDENWAYVEKHNVYAAGRTGKWLRRLLELRVIAQITGYSDAIPVWRARDLREEPILSGTETAQ